MGRDLAVDDPTLRYLVKLEKRVVSKRHFYLIDHPHLLAAVRDPDSQELTNRTMK